MRTVPVTLLLAVACARGDSRSNADTRPIGTRPLLITGDSVGPLRIGMPRDSLRAVSSAVRDTTVTDNEGNPQAVSYVVISGDTLQAEMVDGRVWRIAVTTPDATTGEGVHVGSPLSALLTGDMVTGAAGEGKLYVLDRRRCGVSFGLAGAGRDRGDLDVAALRRLPPSTHVDQILVVGCRARAE